jgi:hypothetical protein
MSDEPDEIVIRGVTTSGKTFRPSDWAERLCGVMSAFGRERHLEYSPYVQPINSGGVKCVVVSRQLQEIERMAFNFLMNFAKDNELQVRPGRGVAREEPGSSAASPEGGSPPGGQAPGGSQDG